MNRIPYSFAVLRRQLGSHLVQGPSYYAWKVGTLGRANRKCTSEKKANRIGKTLLVRVNIWADASLGGVLRRWGAVYDGFYL